MTWLNQTASVLTFGEIETNIMYKVKEGDCLFSIAREILGDQLLWERIYEANKGLIKSPDKVYVGQEFFLVFNILLAGAEGRDPQANWRIGSLLTHVVLPIMYIADWFLFYERRKCKWYYPIASVAFPLAYVVFLLIQAIILKFDSSIMIPTTTTPLIYPYFFVNLETQGVSGVLMWIGILSAAFVVMGYAFLGLDRILKRKNA